MAPARHVLLPIGDQELFAFAAASLMSIINNNNTANMPMSWSHIDQYYEYVHGTSLRYSSLGSMGMSGHRSVLYDDDDDSLSPRERLCRSDPPRGMGRAAYASMSESIYAVLTRGV